MDHIVYVDAKEKELDQLVHGGKSMVIRGAAGRKLPYGRVSVSDVLWFIENNGDGLVKARAEVKHVIHSDRLSPEESQRMIMEHQSKLRLTPDQLKRWTGKRYLVLIEVEKPQPCEAFAIDRREYGNMDDWLPVGNVEQVKVS